MPDYYGSWERSYKDTVIETVPSGDVKHLPRIVIDTIPHKRQRYDTAGDYYESLKDNWLFRISEMDADAEFLVLVHELIEWHLTQRAGIAEEEITRFDIESGHDDPGSLPEAPYRAQHMEAERIEKIVAGMLGKSWKKYTKQLDSLEYRAQEPVDEETA